MMKQEQVFTIMSFILFGMRKTSKQLASLASASAKMALQRRIGFQPICFRMPVSFLRGLFALFRVMKGFLLLGFVFNTQLLSEEGEESVKVRFTVLSLGKAIDDVGYVIGDEVKPFTVPNGAISNEMKYEGPATMIISKRGKNKGNKKVAEVTLEKEMKDVFIVFIETKKEGNLWYKTLLINNTNMHFPKNSYCLYNFTKRPIAGVLNEDKFTMKSYDRHVVEMADTEDTTKISIAFHEGNKMKPLYRSIWGRNPNLRTLVFLIPRGENSRRVTIRKFHQSVEE